MNGLYVRPGLDQAMNELDLDMQLFIEKNVIEWVRQIKEGVKKDPVGVIFGIYEYIDNALVEQKIAEQSSCKKGCNHCCHINVDISEAEALAVKRYCSEYRIPISREYLSKQLTYPKEEIAFSPVSACVFLKDGLCSIYEARPIACRMYYVVTPAEQCNLVKFPHFKTASKICVLAEAMFAAYLTVLGGDAALRRMPMQLIKYAKQ